MYKIILCAGLCMIGFSVAAQHTDEIISDNEPAFIKGIDEKYSYDEIPVPKIGPPDLLKTLPLLDGKNVSLEATLN